MIIKLKPCIPDQTLSLLLQTLDSQKAKYQFSKKENTVVIMKNANGILETIKNHNLSEEIIRIDQPYVLAARHALKPKSQIRLSTSVVIGGKEIVIMAGPCTVEDETQINEAARKVRQNGGQVLRGGAFKPRSSPYDFQGLKETGLQMLKYAAKKYDLLVITEVMSPKDIELIERYADIFQVGTRNMQNYPLLSELGKTKKPVLLKRGMWATYKEFLLAAEYILAGGNNRVILCERGIRTFVTETRFTLDINAIPYLKKETHLPVVADPSHGTGNSELVKDVALASVAAGADGLLIEAHPEPENSIIDKDQVIDFQTLKEIVVKSKQIAKIVRK